ncbi:UNVERIFIED_CONTAM: hypothetical protein H355_008605 [Colinus virginianus]|nr:hypothetical protein H355_008605 [Colinus virginianus]
MRKLLLLYKSLKDKGNKLLLSERNLELWELDDLSASPQLFNPMSPYDVDLPIQVAENVSFGSQFNQPGELPADFSSVDLSFLPDVTQDNKEQNPSEDGHEAQGGLNGLAPRNEDGGIFTEESSSSCPDATQPSLGEPDVCPPLTPMTPMTPVTPASEGSGIVPQLHEEQSRLAARKYARVVQKLGFPAKFLDFKIQNMVGSCDVRFPIRLEGLVLTHQQFSSYEPELFPGLIYRMVKPRIVLLIFVSGKVVLTGAKERSEIYEAFENIYPILRGFKKAS